MLDGAGHVGNFFTQHAKPDTFGPDHREALVKILNMASRVLPQTYLHFIGKTVQSCGVIYDAVFRSDLKCDGR